MRAGPGLELDDLAGGGVALRARDWPRAGWVAVPCAAAGLPLLAWAAVEGEAIEAGGALVALAFACLAAALGLARRRDLEIRPAEGGGALVRGREGAGPFARPVERTVAGPVRLVIAPFPEPDGAPALPDRGGDLLLRGAGGDLHLARRVGPRWREHLGALRERIAARIPGASPVDSQAVHGGGIA